MAAKNAKPAKSFESGTEWTFIDTYDGTIEVGLAVCFSFSFCYETPDTLTNSFIMHVDVLTIAFCTIFGMTVDEQEDVSNAISD